MDWPISSQLSKI